MTKPFSVIAVLLIVCVSSNISYSAENWAKTYGGTNSDIANSVQQTSDGGYIVAAYTDSFGAGDEDFWLLKLDSSGGAEWQKTYGGTFGEFSFSIQQTSGGGYIIAGHTFSFGAGGSDILLLKLDSSGSVEWQRTYGGTLSEGSSSIQQTDDGGYVVVGKTFSDGAGLDDILVLKLDSSGAVLWEKTYGGTNNDIANSVQQTSDGGYIVAGYTSSAGAGENDILLLKLGSSGSVEWQKTYGGSSSEYSSSIQQTGDGGYIVVGLIGSFGAGDFDILVLKLNSSGVVLWGKIYGGAYSDVANSVQQTSDGGYIVVGFTDSFGAGSADVWVLKLNSSGILQWEKTYGGTLNENSFSIQQTSNGGYIVGGFTLSFGAGSADVWVLRLDSSGNIPGCDIISTSNAIVNDAPFLSIGGFFSGDDFLEGTTSDASISPQDTSCTISTVCADDTDTDEDGIPDSTDNCPLVPNGPDLGSCAESWCSNIVCVTSACINDEDCEYNEICQINQEDDDSDGMGDVCDPCPNSIDQEDNYPPGGNGIGDACECEGDFDYDGNMDGSDAAIFKTDFGRSIYINPCSNEWLCNGDFDCDRDVDGGDAALFKEDFGRSPHHCLNCPCREVEQWCVYSE